MIWDMIAYAVNALALLFGSVSLYGYYAEPQYRGPSVLSSIMMVAFCMLILCIVSAAAFIVTPGEVGAGVK